LPLQLAPYRARQDACDHWPIHIGRVFERGLARERGKDGKGEAEEEIVHMGERGLNHHLFTSEALSAAGVAPSAGIPPSRSPNQRRRGQRRRRFPPRKVTAVTDVRRHGQSHVITMTCIGGSISRWRRRQVGVPEPEHDRPAGGRQAGPPCLFGGQRKQGG
jgi:hypothetical protein